MSIADKYDSLADGFSEVEYADPVRYAERRATLIVEVGPRLRPGESVLDLGCGDAIMARPLTRYGLRYAGLDASERMLESAAARNPGLPFALGRIEEYVPPEPVDATFCLRTFYQPADRVAFFRHVAGYTRRKFVFDFRPRTHPAGPIVDDLRAAGFASIELRPFFLPQRRHVPGAAVPAVAVLERSGLLASLVLRRYGRLFCAAWV
jgi:SAM-dependent methyltransferase